MPVLRGVWCGPDGVCLGVGYTSAYVGGVAVLRANGNIGPVHSVGGTFELHDIDCARAAAVSRWDGDPAMSA